MARIKADAKPAKNQPAFRVFGGTYTFRLWPTLITVFMTAVLVALGYWQVQRLHWKTDLIATMRERMQERPIDIGLSIIPPESIAYMDFHPARARGTLQNDKAMFLYAISSNGAGGYHILTPMTLENGQALLVDRGWLPYGLKENPDGMSRDTKLYRPDGAVNLTGLLRLPPDKRPPSRPENTPAKNEWYWVDLPAMAQAAGIKEFLPYYLLADDAPHDGAYPVGNLRQVDIPNNHLSYAITWFWLAIILPIIYFVSSWRMDRPKPQEEPKADPEQ